MPAVVVAAAVLLGVLLSDELLTAEVVVPATATPAAVLGVLLLLELAAFVIAVLSEIEGCRVVVAVTEVDADPNFWFSSSFNGMAVVVVAGIGIGIEAVFVG